MCKTSDARAARRGFTLIEMLIVLAIIVTLASMLLFGANALGIGSKKAKTATILAAVRKGIELTVASKGGSISAAEHPFAGSNKPTGFSGFEFRGWRGRIQPPAPPGTPDYSTVITPGASTSPTYKGAEEWFLNGGDKNRAFMDDDVFCDAKAPGLIGMPRGMMGVIGSQQSYVSRYFNVARPKPRADGDPPVYASTPTPAPYPTYSPYAGHMVSLSPPEYTPAIGLPDDNKKAIDYLFGSSGIQGELSSLKAMFASASDPRYAPDPADPKRSDDNLIMGDLVWSQDHTDWDGRNGLKKEPRPFWEPGRVQEDNGDPWQRYRLRGLAIYDAWEREIFYSYTPAGGVRLLSLGADGAYLVAPYDDHVHHGNGTTDLFDPADPSKPILAEDDKDGLKDNVKQDVAE